MNSLIERIYSTELVEDAEVDISVIIATLNRSDHLQKILESIEKLKVSDDLTYEILLIDNASSDKTKELIDAYARKKPQIYKYFFEARKGKSNALNLGLRNARGEIIMFADDDVIVDPNWLSALWNTFESKPDAIAIQGKILLQKEIERLPPWADPEDLLFCTCYDPCPAPVYADMLVGANMAFRREAFERYGLFDLRLGPGAAGFGDDTEFGMRLERAGEKIYYQPAALVFHEYQEERFAWDYWLRRIEQHARTIAVIDVEIRNRNYMRFRSWRKLVRYYAKYCLYMLIRKSNRKYKYDRKIRFARAYIRAVSKLRNSGSLEV